VTKAEDIEAILTKARNAAQHPMWISVRRVHINGIGRVEFPSWLSELWLLDGHWEETSARFLSKDQFVKELEDVLAVVKDQQHEDELQDLRRG